VVGESESPARDLGANCGSLRDEPPRASGRKSMAGGGFSAYDVNACERWGNSCAS